MVVQADELYFVAPGILRHACLFVDALIPGVTLHYNRPHDGAVASISRRPIHFRRFPRTIDPTWGITQPYPSMRVSVVPCIAQRASFTSVRRPLSTGRACRLTIRCARARSGAGTAGRPRAEGRESAPRNTCRRACRLDDGRKHLPIRSPNRTNGTDSRFTVSGRTAMRRQTRSG